MDCNHRPLHWPRGAPTSARVVTGSLGHVMALIAEMLPAQVGLLKETLGPCLQILVYEWIDRETSGTRLGAKRLDCRPRNVGVKTQLA